MNGFKLDKMTHQAAVNQFHNAGDSVKMVIIPGEERRMAVRSSLLSYPNRHPEALQFHPVSQNNEIL